MQCLHSSVLLHMSSICSRCHGCQALSSFALCCCCLTGIAAEYDDIQKRVAHQTVSAMDSAYCLTCNQQIADLLCKSVSADFQTAVLVMKGRVNQESALFSYQCHSSCTYGSMAGIRLLNGTLSADALDHRACRAIRRVPRRCCYALRPVAALTDNGSCCHVTGLQRMHECFSVYIYKHVLPENEPSLLQERRRSVPDTQHLSDDTEWYPDTEADAPARYPSTRPSAVAP